MSLVLDQEEGAEEGDFGGGEGRDVFGVGVVVDLAGRGLVGGPVVYQLVD